VYRSASTTTHCTATRHKRHAIKDLFAISVPDNTTASIYTRAALKAWRSLLHLCSIDSASFPSRLAWVIKRGTRT
jgi:hypothetical protein